jgi:delta24(24(1))-sterol reductase
MESATLAAGLRQRTAANSSATGDAANGVTDSSKIASGESRALMKPHAVPTEHGQEMDKILDTHTEYEFGGPLGTGAMMLGFPPLMCE